jgi:hypothetical protein
LIKALNYIKYDSIDQAFVEIRRANEKLDLLEQKNTPARPINISLANV